MPGVSLLLRRLWYRVLAFPAPERGRFLRVMGIQVTAGLSDAQVFDNLSRWGHSKAIRDLATASAAQQLRSGYFTDDWVNGAHWPRRDALLLQAAERHRAIPQMARVLSSLGETSLSLWQSVWVPNAVWLGAMAFMVLTLLGMMTQLSLIEQFMDAPAFAVYGQWLLDWGVLGIVVSGGVVALYGWARKTLGYPLRGYLRRVGFFSVADRLFAIEVCESLAILLTLGTTRIDALNILRQVHPGQRYFDQCLSEAMAAINRGHPLPVAFKGRVLDARYANFLHSLAPDGESEALGSALPVVADLLKEDARSALSDLRMLVMCLSLSITMAIVFTLLPMMFGQGLSF